MELSDIEVKPDQPVEKVEGNYAETVAPNGMRIRMPLVDIGAV